MHTAPLPKDEPERLARLRDLGVLEQGRLTWDALPTEMADPTQLRIAWQNVVANGLTCSRAHCPPVYLSAGLGSHQRLRDQPANRAGGARPVVQAGLGS